ncbi:MAG: hypothetical protein HC919_13790 [Oscillatoriales cyanobacterium SM2_2_1]|nr:hypothetical protein [Oscillatoriales cyanobacterium SM2_2_1]
MPRSNPWQQRPWRRDWRSPPLSPTAGTDPAAILRLLPALRNLSPQPQRTLYAHLFASAIAPPGCEYSALSRSLLNLLQGELPAGIFPWQEPEGVLVAADPGIQRELLTGPLFELETDGCYRPNLPKFQHLRAYLQNILDSALQSLNEPLVFPTATPATSRRS